MSLSYVSLQTTDKKALVESLKDLEDVPEYSQEQIESLLELNYISAKVITGPESSYKDAAMVRAAAFTVEAFRFPGNIFQRIREFVCRVLLPGSTVNEIIEAILDALSNIMFGIIFKWIVKPLVKFILRKGYDWLCPVPAPAQ